MMKKVEYAYRFIDSLYMKYLGTLILLTVPVRLVKKFIFNTESLSSIAGPIFLISALGVTILWTQLDLKANPSLFSGYISKNVKEGSITKRILVIAVTGIMLKNAKAALANAAGIFKIIYLGLINIVLTVGILILIISAVLILFRPTRRRKIKK